MTANGAGGKSTARGKPGKVVVYSDSPLEDPSSHEGVTRSILAQRIATLRGDEYAGEYDPAHEYDGPVYFLPAQTLESSQAQTLGIASEAQLFGGIVPHPFVATKTITHPLVSPVARAPQGWSPALAADLEGAVLNGFSAFSAEDLRTAGKRLLARGHARIKPARGVGGTGQTVVGNVDELDAAIAAMDAVELAQYGAVIEENLQPVLTFSVGQVYLAGMWISYWGSQRLTLNHDGQSVYGGSDLVVVRGRFDDLLTLDLEPHIKLAVDQARRYDSAAVKNFPGLIAARRNYDIAQGVDCGGRQRSGVLEQSWRVGGASPAELAALEAFAEDSRLAVVRASSWEFFGMPNVPPGADILYRGVDRTLGAMTKYSLLEDYGNAA